jgi:hypothetical protein
MVDIINEPYWSDEIKKWAKKRFNKLNKHIGAFVNFSDTEYYDIDKSICQIKKI